MEKHSFTPAFYEAVFKEIKESDLTVVTEDNEYGYFDLFLSVGMYDVSLTARFYVSTDSDDFFIFGHWVSNTYPVFENLIEIDNVKVTLTNGTPVEGFSIDDFWKQFNVDKSPSGFQKREKVFFRCDGSQIMRKGTFVAHNAEMDSDVVEEEGTGKIYYVLPWNSFIGKVREPPN